MGKADRAHQDTSFRFGENWASYAREVEEKHITAATDCLLRLVGEGYLTHKRFLDIGCGSGVHALAALRLGAREVLAVDVDADSVATTRTLLERYVPDGNWRVEQVSVFNLDPAVHGTFDVVYSWGVLHHTGDMHRAIRCAANLVHPGGLFVFALYRKTWLCPLWRIEKKWYAHASPRAQATARALYVWLSSLRLRARGVCLNDYIQHYYQKRGMSYYHDVHDWLGGYPYESITPDKVDQVMQGMGFVKVRAFIYRERIRIFGRGLGLFGSGNDEFVYQRTTHPCP
jgi:2-polyprenyl-6-hydroxyphenyl methylase/3-demethylubiquinone-9 3-methyltransferase